MMITEQYNNFLEHYPTLTLIFSLAVLVVASLIANFFVKKILLRLINRLLSFSRDEEIVKNGVIPRLSNIIPALIIMSGIKHIPNVPEVMIVIVQNVMLAFIIITVAMAISAGLNLINTLYMRKPGNATKPIKGYLQILKLAVFLITLILVIAALIDKSPLILLSGLGALAAVLMLVFQDTLLSLVASIQISSSDMVRVGDWIEMPQLNADGDVIDIALHTVKVQNWDKTITTLPTRRLITDPFKNWRGMHESGGRRIKRSIYLDQNSIHFLTDDEKKHLKKFKLIQDYLVNKEKEITEWNKNLGETELASVNSRRLTNIGTFRAYVEQYLKHHPSIHQGMTLLVRQLSPSAEGLPVELYCFTNNTAWTFYESTQSDIFDHLYAILPEFGLSAFQNPSGRDFQSLKSSA